MLRIGCSEIETAKSLIEYSSILLTDIKELNRRVKQRNLFNPIDLNASAHFLLQSTVSMYLSNEWLSCILEEQSTIVQLETCGCHIL